MPQSFNDFEFNDNKQKNAQTMLQPFSVGSGHLANAN